MLQAGDSAQIDATVLDAAGNALDVPVLFLSMSRRDVWVEQDGRVEARRPGDFTIVVRVPTAGADAAAPHRCRAGGARARDDRPNFDYRARVCRCAGAILRRLDDPVAGPGRGADGALRRDAELRYSTGDVGIATIDGRGHLTLVREGRTKGHGGG